MATLDLPAVRHFTTDLHDRVRRCDSGEGLVCSTLDKSINYYVQLCAELREFINQWAHSVFTNQITFDPEAETLLKMEAGQLLRRAKQVAALGRAMDGQCFELEGLNALHYRVADFDYLLDNWVSPRAAVSPSARVKLPAAAEKQIAERIKSLSPLPSDWRPTDPEQLELFRKQKAT